MRISRFFGISIVVSALAIPSLPGGSDKVFWIVPDHPTDPRLRLEDHTWVLPFQGLEIRVRFLDTSGRLAFLEERQPTFPDFFASDGLFPEEYQFFRVDLKNSGEEKVTFHPGNVVVITNKNDQEFPLDYTDFYRRLTRKGGKTEKHLKQVPSLFYDGSLTLRPGESTSKLLAFPAPRRKWKRLQLYVSFLQLGTESHSFRFPFSRQAGAGPEPLTGKESPDSGQNP
ncbi:MAG: hypothetical protein V3T54_03145 [Acidobacteriota bacterium]